MLSRALEEIACAIRVTRDLPGFVRRPISPTQASERLRRRLETREATFVRLVEEAVFNHPISPYRKLFRSISCELGDLRQMVRRHGLEATLSRLADEGLYLTFDEFKGRTPVVRGGHEFRFSDSDFDNPLIRPDFVLWTGGSRAPAMSVRVDAAGQAPSGDAVDLRGSPGSQREGRRLPAARAQGGCLGTGHVGPGRHHRHCPGRRSRVDAKRDLR